MNKEDYVFIAQKQGACYTVPKLWAMKNIADIITLPISDDILSQLDALKKLREPYAKHTVDQIKKILFERRITYPSGANKGGLIDILNSSENTEAFNLDEDQIRVIDHITKSTDKFHVIQAGAGAGKTTTLTHIVKQLIDNEPTERIIVLAYNVAAETAFAKKMKMIKVPRIANANIYDNGKYGAAVCTFDKFGNRVNKFDDHSKEILYDEEEIDEPVQLHSGYRQALERACINLSKNADMLKFTTMVIDEAQDILPQHVQIINVMIPLIRRVIIAGDPMQELYEGASWYRTLLKEHNILCLRYNHRSHPEIVKALNIFAEKNFPDIYVPQIPALPDNNDGTRRFKIITLDSEQYSYVGNVCGEMVSTNDRHYILSPITTSKFGLEPVAPSAQQIINEIRPSTIVQIAKSGENIDTAQCIISTSKLVKGTEAKHVIVFGTELSYSIIVTTDVIARHIYVALSRAIDTLTLVHKTTMDADAHIMLQDLMKFADCSPVVIRCVSNFINTSTTVDVTSGGDFTPESGLCAAESITLGEFRSINSDQIIPIDVIDDLEFVNLFVQSLFMDELGILPFNLDELEIITHVKKYTKLTYENKRHKLITTSQDEPAVRAIIDKVKLLNPSNNAYAYALVKFSIMAGRLWTVSERLEYTEHLNPYIKNCIEQLLIICGKEKEVKFKSCGAYNVQPGRREAGDSTATIAFDINILIGNTPIEIKYFDEITPVQRKRAAIYAALVGSPTALIFNVKTGVIENIACANLLQIEMTAKLTVALRFARDFKIKMDRYPTNQKPVTIPAAKSSCVIVIDAESCDGLTTEIAAVAFSPTDYKILGVYHSLYPGVEIYRGEKIYSKQHEIIAKMTMLTIKNKQLLTSKQEVQSLAFKKWISETSETAPILHWSGSEGKEYENTIDIRNNVYRPWLATGSMKSTKLIDAAEHICRKLNWIPHRAFDDVILTATIFSACTN